MIRGKTTTRPGHLLRNSIVLRIDNDEIEAKPGFFEVDTVAHCGPALNGLLERVLRRHAHRPGVHHRDP